MLAYVSLSRGEALYLPAGVPHSYIRGVGLEVMSSSDNVLRLGLTGKPVFIEEALESLEWDRRPLVARAKIGDRIAPAGAPFAASLVTAGAATLPTGSFRIVLLIDGKGSISTSLADVQLHPGTAAVLSAADPDASISIDGLAAVVTSEDL
jgi:mannose-6-phosphate isomerase